MTYKKAYDLSRRFGPPSVNLRNARLADDFGSESCAKLEINHIDPGDVTREEIDYYSDTWCFMDAQSLVFYLYPVFSHFLEDPSLEGVDFYLYSLNRNLEDILALLKRSEIEILRSYLEAVWSSGYECDLEQCLQLQAFIGLIKHNFHYLELIERSD